MSHVEYDIQGNLIVSITYDTSGEIAEHIKYSYNEQNKMIEELLYDFDEVVEKRQFEYNDVGLIEKEKIFYQDDTFDTIFYSYNAENMLIEKKLVNTDEEIESYHTIQYQNQKIVNEGEYDSENNLIIEKIYSYNSNGFLEKLITFDAFEGESIEIAYEYDEKGNRIKILKYDNKGKLTERSSYKYDDNNQIISLVEDSTLLSTTYTFEYNENGKLSSQKEIDENEELIASITYTYDENMLIETQSEGEGYTHNYIIKNEIVYFEN